MHMEELKTENERLRAEVIRLQDQIGALNKQLEPFLEARRRRAEAVRARMERQGKEVVRANAMKAVQARMRKQAEKDK